MEYSNADSKTRVGLVLCLLLISISVFAQTKSNLPVAYPRNIPFDKGWLFIRDSFSSAEQVSYDDSKGNIVPYVDDLLVRYNIEGNGEIAGVGNGNPRDVSSFQLPEKKVFHGRGLVVIRPKGSAGKITLKAEANGLKGAQIVIATH